MVKVKVALEQTTKVQRWSRGIALFFLNLDARWGVGGQFHAPAALPQGKRHCTHCIGGWVGPSTNLNGCGKSRPHWDSIHGPSSP